MKFQYWIMAVLALTAVSAQAQYKYVGPDGRVTYSDSPPPANAKAVQKKDLGASTGSAASGASLPFAVRQAAQNFPVTLFTAPGCGGCDTARTFLTQRGIPFTEKTVSTAEDTAAFRVATGATSIPVALIGSGKQVGFEAGAWGAALDAAGYPPTSMLPPSYRNPPPTAAAPQEKPAPTAQAQPKPEAAAPAAPAAPAPTTDPARPSWFRGF